MLDDHLPSNLIVLSRATGLQHVAAPLSLDRLNQCVKAIPAAQSGNGSPIEFVPYSHEEGYERGIYACGHVPTRYPNWHDHYNALAWLAYPKTKRACNLRHQQAIDESTPAAQKSRGQTRDALTLWDECGVLVVSSEAALLTGLKEHAWENVFWHHRAAVTTKMRFFVFGHATCEALHAPYFGLCAKARYRQVQANWLAQPLAAQLRDVDDELAHWLEHSPALKPKDLSPLPLLGIPGCTPLNELQAYYQDTQQFRPRRQ